MKIDIDIPQQFYDDSNFSTVSEYIHYFRSNFQNFTPELRPGTSPAEDVQRMTVRESVEFLLDQFEEKIVQEINFEKLALQQVQEEGIVFIDEIDKIAVPEGYVSYSKSPSADGVQRDLLPLIEGSTVNTKWGDVKTDHILFIGSGAFSQSKPTDLIPELLGRLPIRVELKPLTKDDFIKILKVKEDFNR